MGFESYGFNFSLNIAFAEKRGILVPGIMLVVRVCNVCEGGGRGD